MQFLDFNQYIYFEGKKNFKVLACMSKAIYCICLDDNASTLFAFTSLDIVNSPISIRVSNFNNLACYLENAEKLNLHFYIEVNKFGMDINNVFFYTTVNVQRSRQFTYLPFEYLKSDNLKGYLRALLLDLQWQSTQVKKQNYSLEYRSILSKIMCTGLGILTPLFLSKQHDLTEYSLVIEASDLTQIDSIAVRAIRVSKKYISLYNKSIESNREVHHEQELQFLIKYAISSMILIENGLRQNKQEYLDKAVLGLIGNGQGLTPSGDDFLIGLLNVLKLSHQHVMFEKLSLSIQNTLENTNKISRAFLIAALDGQISDALSDVLNDIIEYDVKRKLKEDISTRLLSKIARLFLIGHSSGIDALMGVMFGLSVLTKMALSK